MQRTSSYSHLLHHETGAEYSGVQPAPQSPPNLGATALIGAGFFLLIIWSLSLMTGRSSHSAISLTPSAAIAAAAFSDDTLTNAPPSFMPVACDRLTLYHWQFDCPLSKPPRGQSRLLRPIAQRKDRWLTRRKAQLDGYGPCIYCAEIKFWRSRKNSSSQST